MRLLCATLCLLLTSAAPAAWAQPGPPTSQESLLDRITSARLALERIADAQAVVRTQRDETARKHEVLAAEIRARKLAGSINRLLPDLELQQQLQRSQELAQSLTLLNRELDALQHARREQLEQLVLAYGALIAQTAEQARAAKGQRRADLLAVLRQARREDEAVRWQLSPSPIAPRELGSDLLASDDPQELSEQVDAVRDEQDRLRRELARLEQQIEQRRGESRLDREMRDFMSDQEIFDEGSRVVIVPRSASPAAVNENTAPPGGKIGEDDGVDADALPGEGAYAGGEGGTSDLQGGGSPTSGFGTSNSLADFPRGRLPAGVGEDGGTNGPPADGGLSLEQRRAQIVARLKQLQVLHDRLQEKLEDLDRS